MKYVVVAGFCIDEETENYQGHGQDEYLDCDLPEAIAYAEECIKACIDDARENTPGEPFKLRVAVVAADTRNVEWERIVSADNAAFHSANDQ